MYAGFSTTIFASDHPYFEIKSCLSQFMMGTKLVMLGIKEGEPGLPKTVAVIDSAALYG
jgi:hypothetical protein